MMCVWQIYASLAKQKTENHGCFNIIMISMKEKVCVCEIRSHQMKKFLFLEDN